jgi:hypothetical protein
MTENERLEYLIQARICMRIARDYLGVIRRSRKSRCWKISNREASC